MELIIENLKNIRIIYNDNQILEEKNILRNLNFDKLLQKDNINLNIRDIIETIVWDLKQSICKIHINKNQKIIKIEYKKKYIFIPYFEDIETKNNEWKIYYIYFILKEIFKKN